MEVANSILDTYRRKFVYLKKNFDKIEKAFEKDTIKSQGGSKKETERKQKMAKKNSIAVSETSATYENATVYEDPEEKEEKKDPVLD